jgi:uncharacterized membrane protein
MATPASIRKHPIHPMLVVFPIALWTTAVVFDVIGTVTGNASYRTVAFYNLGAGVLGALAAAVPGIIDYLTLRGRAAKVGTWHAALNLIATVFFALSWLGRTRWGIDAIGRDTWLPELAALIGLALIVPAGWLGGALVYEHGMGVTLAPARSAPDRRRAA